MDDMSRWMNIFFKIAGVSGNTWKGTFASLLLRPCMVISTMKLFIGKGWSMASCRYLTEDSKCFRWGKPEVLAINSKKHVKVSTEAGHG